MRNADGEGREDEDGGQPLHGVENFGRLDVKSADVGGGWLLKEGLADALRCTLAKGVTCL